jgi:hypothetical protein
MTPKQSTARLVLYVMIAMLTAASSGIATINYADLRETVQFAMGILVTGLVTARSYIDQTPTQVEK